MSDDNRFRHCTTPDRVLTSYLAIGDNTGEARSDALERIAELTLPIPPPVVAGKRVSAEELIAVIGAHVYGDRGPFTRHPHRFSVCTRAADDLSTRYVILRNGSAHE